MNVSKMMRAFDSTSFDLPEEAMLWARENQALAVPVLLDALNAYAFGGSKNLMKAGSAFFATFLLAEMRETRALPAFCALARDDGHLDEFVRGGPENPLHGLLASVAGSDVALLQTVIEDPAAGAQVRSVFLGHYFVQVLSGDVPPGQARDYLAGLFATLQPQNDEAPWYQWCLGLILLAPDIAMPLVEEVFARGWVEDDTKSIADMVEFRDRIAADRDGEIQTIMARHPPIADAIAELSAWRMYQPGFKAEVLAQLAKIIQEEKLRKRLPADDLEDGIGRLANRKIGRNDPCPCGSGLKFKKCCAGKVLESF